MAQKMVDEMWKDMAKEMREEKEMVAMDGFKKKRKVWHVCFCLTSLIWWQEAQTSAGGRPPSPLAESSRWRAPGCREQPRPASRLKQNQSENLAGKAQIKIFPSFTGETLSFNENELTYNICQGHDVVFGEGESFDLGEFAGLMDVGDNLS